MEEEKDIREEIVSEKLVTPEVKKEVVEKRVVKRRKRGIFRTVINLIVWVIIIVWVAICLIDYMNVQNEKDPMFCLKEETINYSDGTVDLCTGLGYKIYNYKRTSYSGLEFGPFWISDRSNK